MILSLINMRLISHDTIKHDKFATISSLFGQQQTFSNGNNNSRLVGQSTVEHPELSETKKLVLWRLVFSSILSVAEAL